VEVDVEVPISHPELHPSQAEQIFEQLKAIILAADATYGESRSGDDPGLESNGHGEDSGGSGPSSGEPGAGPKSLLNKLRERQGE
jgi:hypothetical protein